MKHKLERAVKISKKIPSEAAYLTKYFDQTQIKFNDKALEAVLNDLQNMNYDASNYSESNNNTQKMYKDCVRYKDKVYSQEEIEKKISGGT